MNCENALELMNRELDEALTAEESAALQAHLDACPDCRGTWRQLHELDALLQESELEPPAALHEGVMREIRQEQKRKPRRAWLPAAAIAAAAALVLLAGKAGLIARPGFEQTDVISVNIGSAVEQIFAQTGAKTPDEAAAQQAADVRPVHHKHEQARGHSEGDEHWLLREKRRSRREDDGAGH